MITWTTATIDLPDETFGQGKAFWGAVTGYRPVLPPDNDPNYAILQPQVGDAHLWLQRLVDGDPGIHLDLDVARDDLAALVDRAESLGAHVLARPSYVVLASPAGVRFCLLPHDGRRPERAQPAVWDTGRSIADQVCLDVAFDAWDAELAFWAGLTGWELQSDERWARLWTPAAFPLRVLLQRRESGGTTAHLDVSADDRVAETARWVEHGARVVGEGPRWTVLDTPGGLTACLTQRDPDTGLLPPGAGEED